MENVLKPSKQSSEGILRATLGGNPPKRLSVGGWESILEFFYPAYCVGCGVSGSVLCETCERKVAFVQEEYCSQCGLERNDVPHRTCTSHLFPSRLYSAVWYRGPIVSLIHALKYDAVKTTVPVLSSFVSRRISGWRLPAGAFVVPVPLHPLKYGVRQWNQAALFARRIAPLIEGVYCEDVVKRMRLSASQTVFLSSVERAENIRGAFSLTTKGKEVISNRSIVIVDDVWTTGSTVRELSRVLREGGSGDVVVVTVARAHHQDGGDSV